MTNQKPARTTGSSKWQCGPTWQADELPIIGSPEALALLPEFDLWDCWPLQHEDGSTAEIDGCQYWFFLSSPRIGDPGERHHHARIRLFRYEGGHWTDLGPVLSDDKRPGNADWAGSCVLHDDGRTISLFFTAAGRRGEGPSFEQRIFACTGELVAGSGPGRWQTPTELFSSDGELFTVVDQVDGLPGEVKAFRDPAWFRDPATGKAHLLFTGSAAYSDDPHNGVIGFATMGADGWTLGTPLIDAVGVNNELERPHVLFRDGLYYLFWSTQRHTFSPGVAAGPNGLYCAVAENFEGPWSPANTGGLVVSNPAAEPMQAYSWWVTGEGEVWSFVDYWGMEGRSLRDHPELQRERFGGTPAPRFRLKFEGRTVGLAGPA